MVEACLKVICVRRLAALPVGAARRILLVIFSEMARIARVMVLFPVPGPPVTIRSLSTTPEMTATFCSGASARLSFSCTHSIAFSSLTLRKDRSPKESLASSLAMPISVK